MIVVDASVLAPALGDNGIDGDQARSRLRGERLAAPELIDLEVSSVLRRFVLAGQLAARRADLALTDLIALPSRRFSHRVLLPRCWSLRENLTIYEAAYGALAKKARRFAGDRGRPAVQSAEHPVRARGSWLVRHKGPRRRRRRIWHLRTASPIESTFSPCA